MQLRTFDGGLSKRVDASLILPNEGVKYCNIDNESLVLKSEKGLLEIGTEVRGYFYNHDGTWLSSAGQRTYVEYNNNLYFTEENVQPKKFNGFQESNLGIIQPYNKLTATQAEPSIAEKISASETTLQYTYTYYNETEGVESVPAPLSDELVLAANKVVDLTGFAASTDVQVTHIRIYRIGDSITTMTLVEEIEHDVGSFVTSYRDELPTLDLEGSLLDSYNNFPPVQDLRFLAQAYGIMFGAVGSTLYFSSIGKPDYWPATNTINFADTITGVFPVSNGILIQSKTRTDLLVGSDASGFAKLKVSDEHGCVNNVTNKAVKSVPIWLSVTGFVKYENGIVQLLSRDKLGKLNINVINTAVLDEVYYALKDNGKILALDTRYNIMFKDIVYNELVSNIAVYESNIYAGVNEKLNQMFTGDSLELSYLSPVITENNHSQIKLYNNVYVRSDGEFIFTIFIDGKEVSSKVLTGNKIHDVLAPADDQRGSSIQFGVTGIGIVYEIEYKTVGRQNGR